MYKKKITEEKHLGLGYGHDMNMDVNSIRVIERGREKTGSTWFLSLDKTTVAGNSLGSLLQLWRS